MISDQAKAANDRIDEVLAIKAKQEQRMKIAYADPVYLGQSRLYPEHPRSSDWDNPETHRKLIAEMDEQYDGWILSLSAPSLPVILPMCGEDVRVLIWVKTFAAFKKHVNPAHAWEPIIIKNPRPRTDSMTYMRDWVAEPITLKKGLTGAKPQRVLWFLFDAMNMQPGDDLIDLFPGTGIAGESWNHYSKNYDETASQINRVTSAWEMGKGHTRDRCEAQKTRTKQKSLPLEPIVDDPHDDW